MIKVIYFLFFFSYISNAFSALNPQVDLYANFETIGINVIFRGGVYPSQNTVANIYYSETEVGTRGIFESGFPLTRVNDTIFTGSIFWLTAEKNYIIRLEIIDASNPSNNFIQTYTKDTKAEIEFPSESKSWYVSPTGNSNLYTINSPGSLKGGLDSVKAGEAVVLLGGTYYFGEYDIARSGLNENPITIRGMDGQIAILDGSMPINPLFVREQNAAVDVYKTTVDVPYSNCLFLDGQRLYPYKSKKELDRFNYDGFNLETNPFLYDSILNIGLPGYFRDDRIRSCTSTYEYFLYPSKSLWVKFPDGSNPNNLNIKISQERYCFNVVNKNFIVFKNLDIQYYGVWPEARAIFFDNSIGSIISDCKFSGNNYSVILEGTTQNTTIQDNEFIDGMQNWDTYMMKATTHEGFCPIDEFGNALTTTCHLFVPSPPSPPLFPITFPATTYFPDPSIRQMEISAISVGKIDFSGKGNVIRRNSIKNLQSMTIGFGFNELNGNYEETTEMDVYENDISNSFDDGLEVDGLGGNIRFWGNTFSNTSNMFSLAPVRRGPIYMLRNIGKDFNTSRFFLNDKSKLIVGEGSPLKFNCGDEQNFCANSGSSYFINNTVYHQKYNGDKYGFGLWLFNVSSSPLKLIYAKNNVFITQNNYALDINMPDKMELDYNMYYNNSDEKFANVYQRLPQSLNGEYPTLTSFSSATGFEGNGFYENAQFEEVVSGNFSPAANGNLVDRALLINGINQNYCGNGPDIGAIELSCIVGIEETLIPSKLRIFPNPNNGKFVIYTNEAGKVSLFNSIGIAIICSNLNLGNSTFDLSGQVVSGIYFILFEGETTSETIKIIID